MSARTSKRGWRLSAAQCLALAAALAVALAPGAHARDYEPGTFKLAAVGDSVTAGFGYFDDASLMTKTGPRGLLNCKPLGSAHGYNGRCSSNSLLGPKANETEPTYAPDYGLANGVSWAAQYANAVGVPAERYQNLAVTGTKPADWISHRQLDGQFAPQLERVVHDDPDMTLVTLGANPLVGQIVGPGKRLCADERRKLSDLGDCVRRTISELEVEPRLELVYHTLLEARNNHVVVMGYPTIIPANIFNTFTAEQMAFMEDILDDTIRAAVREVSRSHHGGGRIFYVKPPPFTLGIGPGDFACGPGPFFDVDGPSHQPGITQSQMRKTRPFSFCGIGSLHPVNGQRQPVDAQPWALSSDTGIHPNQLGYEQMANAVFKAVKDEPWAPPRTVCPEHQRINLDGECEPLPDPPPDGEFTEPPRFWRATAAKTDLFVEANRWNTFGDLLAAKQLNGSENSNSMRWQDLIITNLGVKGDRGRAVFPIKDGPADPVAPLSSPVYDFGRLKVGCTQAGYVISALRVYFQSAFHPDGWFYPTDTDAPYRTLELGIAIKKPWFTGFLPKTLTVVARVKCDYYPQLAEEQPANQVFLRNPGRTARTGP